MQVMRIPLSAVVVLVIAAAQLPVAPKPPTPQSSDLPLPDPLVMKDGTRVATKEQWQARRQEMLRDILAIQFGHMPAETPDVEVVRVTDSEKGSTPHSQRRYLTLRTGPNMEITIRAVLMLPRSASAPFPVIVKVGGGHPDQQGVNQRGYAIAMVDTAQLDPGPEGQDVVGPIQAAYPDLDWGSLAVWAWGVSRVLDALETQEYIDTSRTIVTGHSRTGKAALLAGATDERFQIVVPNGSGCGGAATYRNYRPGSETLELLTRPERWQFWMQKDLRDFAGREQDLPFDQHFLRALVAPRVVLSNDGYDDTWANLFGTQVCYQAAQSVFDLLEVPRHNMARFREGGHTFNAEDAGVMLDAADWFFHDAAYPDSMNNIPDEDYQPRLFPFTADSQ